MLSARHVAFNLMEAERAFGQAKRAPRGGLFRRRAEAGRLEVHDQRSLVGRSAARSGVREIPLTAIAGTFDPGRARQFDRDFRPAETTRRRWLSVWLGEHTGAGLPPISVIAVGDTFAVVDGHHRVSVARSRGATTIAAIVS